MSIPVPAGFRLAAVHSGLKRNPEKADVVLIVADAPAVAAGTYTQNRIFAAPVALDRARTPSDHIRAIVANSGNANACTGERGMRDAEQMAALAAEAVGAAPVDVLVLSTGIIGEYLPMEKISAGIGQAAAQLAAGEDAFLAAARGILTTDKSQKVAGGSVSIDGHDYSIAGMAKGAGMIGPRMATMLAVILTDAPLTSADAQATLSEVVEQTFNCISVEGHTSTNDTVLLLSSGANSGTPLTGEGLAAFQQELLRTCTELARTIPSDGEGASHLITIEVSGCRTRDEARTIARTIADSPLVKTAIHGNDPNWGRIVSAVGYAGIPFDPAGLALTVNGTPLFKDGAPLAFDAPAVSAAMKASFETSVAVTLGEGSACCRFYTSDLTAEYIHINADYHT